MDHVKRVLWVDDRAQNKASRLFSSAETKIVCSMDDAISEITGGHLYEYDTIVLDIDFGNGISNPEKVINRLSKKIYLSKDQRNKNYIISNGGYLS